MNQPAASDNVVGEMPASSDDDFEGPAGTPHIPSLDVPIRRIADTSYAAFEVRPPRAVFTRKLERICNAADERPEVDFEYRGLYGTRVRAKVRLVRLWVAGSYARGAATCGDLDLIFEHEVLQFDEPGAPETKHVGKALLGALPEVRTYAGTPQKNTSHLPMMEAVLLWSGPGCDWRAALEQIRLDPAAGPAQRRTSVLPFRMEQTHGAEELAHLEDLIDAREKGLVEWEFIPFDVQLLEPIPVGLLTGELGKAAFALNGVGTAKRRVVPAILRLLHARYAGTGALLHWHPDALVYGNTVVRLGRVFVRTACLSEHLAHSEVMVVPELTKRGPNGAWLVRRGPLHPLSRLLADARYWTAMKDADIEVTTLVNMEEPSWAGNSVQMIELFRDRDGVENVLEGYEPGDAAGMPGLADGVALLRALASCHRVEVEGNSGHVAVLRHHELRLVGHGARGAELLDAGLLQAPQPERHRVLRRQLADLNNAAEIVHRHMRKEVGAEIDPSLD